jgi:hypothetical protein
LLKGNKFKDKKKKEFIYFHEIFNFLNEKWVVRLSLIVYNFSFLVWFFNLVFSVFLFLKSKIKKEFKLIFIKTILTDFFYFLGPFFQLISGQFLWIFRIIWLFWAP